MTSFVAVVLKVNGLHSYQNKKKKKEMNNEKDGCHDQLMLT